MAELTPDRDPTISRQALQVPEPEFPTKTPAVAAQALCHQFLANADRGDHAANDALVTELVRRIRARQAAPEPPD